MCGLPMQNDISVIEKNAQKEVSVLRWVRPFCAIFSSIIGPICISLLVDAADFKTLLAKDHAWGNIDCVILIALAAFIVFQIVCTVFVMLGASLAQEAHVAHIQEKRKMRAVEDNLRKSKERIQAYSVLVQIAKGWEEIQSAYAVEGGIIDQEEMIKAIQIVMSTMVIDGRDYLFHFSTKNIWSFGIYLYDKKEGRLKPVYRQRHDRHPSISHTGSGRVWEIGQGHVGACFANRRTIRGPGQGNIPDNKRREYDDEAYTNYVATPIGMVHQHDSAHPFGVLIVTTSGENCFSEVSESALELAAHVLANLMYTNGHAQSCAYRQD
jgi:hypothetical protein